MNVFKTCEPKPGEDVLLLPSCGIHDDKNGVWRIPICAWIFATKPESKTRRRAISLLARALGVTLNEENSKLYTKRALLLLADNKGNRKLSAEIAGKHFDLKPSCSNGRSDTILSIVASGLTEDVLPIRLLTVDGRELCAGRVYLPSRDGLSIISDIDDTIKITEVSDRAAMVQNTFLKPFQAVKGIAAIYRRWFEAGALFHYVSASPWQLYPPLADFIAQAGFPEGSFHLRRVRWKDSSMLNLFRSSDRLKRAHIEGLLRCYPYRRFVLVGDLGEGDPELFGDFARHYPAQVVRAFFRQTAQNHPFVRRLQQAFDGARPGIWSVFDDAEELRELDLQALARRP